MWLIATGILAAATEAPGLPAWMAGCWEHLSGEKWIEECWTPPRAGIMLGSGRSGTGDALGDWEAMQIVQVQTDDPAIPRMTFYGAPGGQNRTAFDWVGGDGQSVTFVNESHDYPQRIRYWRDGKELVAEIALKDGSRSVKWRFKRTGD